MPIARRAAVAVLALLSAVLLGGGRAVADSGGSGGVTINVTVPGTVTCTTNDGTALGTNPTLRPGAQLICTITAGFGPNEQVDVTQDGDPTALATVTADTDGSVTVTLTVADDAPAGAHTLTFTGETTKAFAIFPFTIATSTTTTTPAPTTTTDTGGPGGGTSSTGTGPSGLVFTGAYVVGPVIGGLALVVAGMVLAMASRRRRRHG